MEQRSWRTALRGIGSADAGSASEVERLVEVRRHEACTAEVVLTLEAEVAAEEAKDVSSSPFPQKRQAEVAMTIPCRLARRA